MTRPFLARTMLAASASLLVPMSVASSPMLPDDMKLPPGSFIKTCTVRTINWQVGTMNADCRRRNGSWSNNLSFYFRYCVPGSIQNRDGLLVCEQDEAMVHEDMKASAARYAEQQRREKAEVERRRIAAARDVLRPRMMEAALVVFGRAPTPLMYDGWFDQYRAANPDGPFANADKDVLMRFLIGLLTARGAQDLRTSTINNGVMAAHGRPATAAELAAYDPRVANGELWFQRVEGTERTRLNASPALRGEMIPRAFNRAIGRAPTAAELAQWRPRSEDHAALVEAQRIWLYAPAGSTELTATAARALAQRRLPNGPIFAAEAVARCRPVAQVYAEMIQYDGCAAPKATGR